MFTAGIIVASPTETLAANPVLTLILNEVIPQLNAIGDRLSNIENALGICTDGETQSCGTDVGACQEGIQTCAGGVFGACIGEIGPSAETCNNVDDDCDGTIDESLVVACGSNVGECSEGTSTCAAGVFGACVGGVEPSTETCDGLDNDCDGVIDNNAANESCNDSLFCTGPELCQSGMCVSSGDPCAGNVGDNDTDCSESCDEAADSCTANDPISVCSLGFCDGDGTCIASVCGNGIVELFEQCDDGNNIDNDDCTNSCLFGGGGG